MTKDEFLEKHNPDDNFPYWQTSLAKDTNDLIETVQADTELIVIGDLRRFLKQVNKEEPSVALRKINEWSYKYLNGEVEK